MPARPIRYLAAIALWALPIQAGAQSQPALEVLRVTHTADDGAEASLRWAFERNNTAPGRFRIEIAPAGQAPHVIKLASPLPAIKGPVAIEGAAWKRSGEFIVLDGSGYIEDKGLQTCPGAVPGQYGTNVRTTTNPGLALVDTQGVEISGLEVRNFCIGVAPPPGSLAMICPDGAPHCQAPPNGELAAPTLERARKSANELSVQGALQGKPLSRFTVEVFGNRAPGSSEGEIFLGDVVTTSDAEGNGKFWLAIDASKLAALPLSFTATLTSADGATSEFSKPITLSE